MDSLFADNRFYTLNDFLEYNKQRDTKSVYIASTLHNLSL